MYVRPTRFTVDHADHTSKVPTDVILIEMMVTTVSTDVDHTDHNVDQGNICLNRFTVDRGMRI